MSLYTDGFIGEREAKHVVHACLGFFVFIETNKVSETLRIQAVDLQTFIGDIGEYPLFVG